MFTDASVKGKFLFLVQECSNCTGDDLADVQTTQMCYSS